MSNHKNLNAKQLRDLEEDTLVAAPHPNPIYLILDGIYDTYNIGGLFRLADALCITKLYICGDSETPPNHRIKKASIGTYKIVPWKYTDTAVDAIEDLRAKQSDTAGENIQIVSIEQHKSAVAYTEHSFTVPLALIVGNETHGVSPEALQASDAIVDLPMHGINKSLNVIVSAAIVGYHVFDTLKLP